MQFVRSEYPFFSVWEINTGYYHWWLVRIRSSQIPYAASGTKGRGIRCTQESPSPTSLRPTMTCRWSPPVYKPRCSLAGAWCFAKFAPPPLPAFFRVIDGFICFPSYQALGSRFVSRKISLVNHATEWENPQSKGRYEVVSGYICVGWFLSYGHEEISCSHSRVGIKI